MTDLAQWIWGTDTSPKSLTNAFALDTGRTLSCPGEGQLIVGGTWTPAGVGTKTLTIRVEVSYDNSAWGAIEMQESTGAVASNVVPVTEYDREYIFIGTAGTARPITIPIPIIYTTPNRILTVRVKAKEDGTAGTLSAFGSISKLIS